VKAMHVSESDARTYSVVICHDHILACFDVLRFFLCVFVLRDPLCVHLVHTIKGRQGHRWIGACMSLCS
jgi:hypothetical protein